MAVDDAADAAEPAAAGPAGQDDPAGVTDKAGAPLARDRSLRHAVEAHLLEAIRSGSLRPGDRLHEVALARTLGVSLTPVREAIFRLVHDGLVEHRPRRGFYLTNLTSDDVEEVHSFRAALEGLAAARAASRLASVDAAALDALIAAGTDAARRGDPLRNAECNAAFHAIVVRAARHSLLDRAWRLLAPYQWLLMPAGVPAGDPQTASSWEERHRRLLSAIQSGDPVEAERAAREHVTASARNPRRRVGPVAGGEDLAAAAAATDAGDHRPAGRGETGRRRRVR